MDQKQKAFKIFDDLEKGQVIVIETYATRDPESFTRYAKEYIDSGGGLIFSNDYTSIRKCESAEEVKNIIQEIENKIYGIQY